MKKGDLPDNQFDPEQSAKGIKVEKEHTDDESVAKQIAKAHLAEFPNYYTALDEMEKKLKKAEALAPSEDEVALFLKHHPNPQDKDLHAWAELHGYEPDNVEEIVYRMLTKKLHERTTPSGRPTDKPFGVPKTDEERKAMHKKLYGTTELPPRGTGRTEEKMNIFK